jgi:hypothetical protein
MAVSSEPVAGVLYDRHRNGNGVVGESAIPETDDPLQEQRRRDALDVVKRWETEYRRKGGRASISPADLERLRRAIL